MNCDRVRELVSDWLDGALDSSIAGELERHLDACADCRALVADVRALVADLAAIAGETAAGPELADRLIVRVPRVPRPGGMALRDLRRVAGWGFIVAGLSWQLGGGALAARAMGQAGPVLADARQAVERTRREGLAAQVDEARAGMARLVDGVRSASALAGDTETR